MCRRERIRYSTEVAPGNISQKLLKREVDVIINPINGCKDQYLIAFRNDLDRCLRWSLGRFKRKTRLISGQKPSVIEIFTKEDSNKKVLKFRDKLQKKGIEIKLE